jgi:hypothetical protein
MDSEILPQSYGQPSITKYECWSLIFSKKNGSKMAGQPIEIQGF